MIQGKDYIGVGVDAVILNSRNQALIALRGPGCQFDVNKWEVPGGKVEFGDGLEYTVKKEVKEEVGVDVSVLELICVRGVVDGDSHWVGLTYLCEIVEGKPEIQEQTKMLALRWIKIEDMKMLNLFIYAEEDVKMIMKHWNKENGNWIRKETVIQPKRGEGLG